MQRSTFDDPVYKIVKKLIKAAESKLPECGELDAETVHDIRVCTKKLRALVQLYRPLDCKTEIKALEREVASLAKSLSASRDQQVLAELLVEFQRSNSRTDDERMAQLSNRLLCLAQSAENPVQANAEHVKQVLLKIRAQWKKQLRQKSHRVAFQGVGNTYRKARKLAYEAESSDLDKVYHDCRKWVKYLGYQLKLLVPIERNKDKAFVKKIENLGEILGKFHDRCVLELRLNALLQHDHLTEAVEASALLVLTWTVERKRLDKQQCHELFEALFTRPALPIKW